MKELSSAQIELAKRDAELTADVCVQYKNLVIGIARKFLLDGGKPDDDLVQEGMIGLLKAIAKYDSNKGAFSTFATYCVKGEIISALRRANAAAAQPANILRIEKNNLEGVLPSSENDLLRLEEFSQYEERLRNVRKVLSKKENEVLDLYVEGMTYAQMAGRLETNTKSIENSIKRIREKLKEEKWQGI